MSNKTRPPKTKASGYTPDPDAEREIKTFGSLYMIAHTLAERDVDRTEHLIYLTEMLEGEQDESERGVMIETLAFFTFMHTSEFMAAFREYRLSFISPLNPFWLSPKQESKKGGSKQ
jgi:hypothetical protein